MLAPPGVGQGNASRSATRASSRRRCLPRVGSPLLLLLPLLATRRARRVALVQQLRSACGSGGQRPLRLLCKGVAGVGPQHGRLRLHLGALTQRPAAQRVRGSLLLLARRHARVLLHYLLPLPLQVRRLRRLLCSQLVLLRGAHRRGSCCRLCLCLRPLLLLALLLLMLLLGQEKQLLHLLFTLLGAGGMLLLQQLLRSLHCARGMLLLMIFVVLQLRGPLQQGAAARACLRPLLDAGGSICSGDGLQGEV